MTACVLMCCLLAVVAAPPEAPRPLFIPDRILFQTGPRVRADCWDVQTGYWGSVTHKEGTTWSQGGTLYVNWRKVPLQEYIISTPQLVSNDVIAARGALYRVRVGSDSMGWRRLEATGPYKGLEPSIDTIAVPLATPSRRGSKYDDGRVALVGEARLYGTAFQVAAIEPTSEADPTLVARLFNRQVVEEGKYVDHEATLREGDYLSIKDNAHKVLRLVPRDKKTKVVGWMVLAGDPTPDETLKKLGKRPVRLVKVKK